MATKLDELIVELKASDKGLEASLAAAQSRISRLEAENRRAMSGIESAVLRARNAVLTLGTAYAAFRVGKGIVEAGIQMEAMRNRMRAATGDAAITAESLAFVRAEAQRLGLDIRTTADGFSGFAASALRAGLTFQQTKEIFTGVSEAATSMRLGGEQTALVFKALEQIAGKGTVSMEELRGQLGDALPGAFEIAAKAMGKSTSEFAKMVANGEVMSSEFLPKFGAAVRKELGGSVDEASKGAQAAFNRMGNAFFELQTKMAESGFLDAITKSVNDMTDALNDPKTVAGLVSLANALATIAQIALQVGSAIGTALYKIGEFETKALAMVGLGAGAKGNLQPIKRIAVAPRPDTSGLSADYTLGKTVMPAASADAKGEKARLAAAKQAEQLRERLAQQVDSMRYQFAGPEQQAAMDVQRQQETLREALEAKAITEQEFRDLSLEAEMEYQTRLQEIRDLAREEELTAFEAFLGVRLQSQQDLNRATLQEQASSFARSIALGAQHNRLFFALEKARAIAAALISARESVVHAYNFGSRIGGPFLGATFAGVAAAAQAANIAAIASTSYGGGSSVGASGDGGESYAGSGDTGGSASVAPTKVMQITLVGSEIASWSKNQVRELIDLINDAQRDGSRVQLVNA